MFLLLGGVSWGFALISEPLKDRLNLKQTEIDTVAFFGVIGGHTGIVPGLFYNRFGPGITMVIGMAMTWIGYAFLGIIAAQYLAIKSLGFTCFANLLFAHGTAWLCIAGFPLIAQNFPERDHGKLLGLGKAYLALGPAFFATFRTDLANGDVETYMISTMIFLTVASLISGWYLVQLPPKLAVNYLPGEVSKYSIGWWYFVSFSFAIYLVALAIIQTVYSFNVSTRYILYGIAMLLWICPWILALFCHGDRSINYHSFCEQTECLSVNDISMSVSVSNVEELGKIRNQNDSNEVDTDTESNSIDVGMPGIFWYWEFYVLYSICLCAAGSWITFTDNTPQIIESASSNALHDYENNDVSTSMVAITSFGSVIGRLVGGFVVDYYASKCHCSLWLIVSPFIMTLTMSSLFFVGTNLMALRVGGLFVGISFGWHASVIVVSYKALWGTKYLSGNYSLFDTPNVVAGFVFSTWIFASIYDDFAEREKEEITYFKGLKCYGSDCYKWTLMICAGCSFIACILAIVHWRFTNKKRMRSV